MSFKPISSKLKDQRNGRFLYERAFDLTASIRWRWNCAEAGPGLGLSKHLRCWQRAAEPGGEILPTVASLLSVQPENELLPAPAG